MRGRLTLSSIVIGVCAGALAIPFGATAQQTTKRQTVRSLQKRMLRQQAWWKNESTAAEIGLSEEQIQRLDEMADRGRQQVRAVRQRYFAAYRALIEALSSDAASNEIIGEKRGELIETWSALTALGVDQLIEMSEILTEEQWTKLPEVAPRALRLGNVSLRGSGIVGPEEPAENGD